MLKKLILIPLGILVFAYGLVMIITMTSESSLRTMMVSPFCQDELTSYGDNIFCVEDGVERNMTAPVVITAIACIWVGILLIMLAFFWDTLAGVLRQGRILKEGIPATGTILQIKTTGFSINDHPLYDVLLQVKTDFQPPYQVTVRTRINIFQVNMMKLGAQVPVKVDRRNPLHVAIDLVSIMHTAAAPINAQNTGSSLPARLRELEESLNSGLITRQEYDRLRQRILEEV